MENCQLGVFLTYVSTKGWALIDRELYLPDASWCADREWCLEAGIGDDVEFATRTSNWPMPVAICAAGPGWRRNQGLGRRF
jgi:hypothetical protein